MSRRASAGLWSRAGRRLWADRRGRSSIVLLALISTLAIFAPMLSGFNYDEIAWDAISQSPSIATGHWFGTDGLGRDLFVRTFMGARISLMVGLLATLVSVIIGVPYGAIAGFVGGRVDGAMMRIVDVLYAMPFMFFVIILVVVFGRNIYLIFIGIGAVEWLTMARIVRGQTLSLKAQPFVLAARAAGAGDGRIIFRHIVPNLMGTVIVFGTLTIPGAILTESFISFLGLGIQEPMTSWGVLVADGAREMETAPWMLLFPGFFLAVTLLSFNFLGDALRDALDPKLERSETGHFEPSPLKSS